MNDPQYTFKSSDKLKAVAEPPTVINEATNKMELDPRQVIKAWADSAEVLREVVHVCETNQAAAVQAREDVVKVVSLGIRASVAVFVLHLLAVGTMLWTTFYAAPEALCSPKTLSFSDTPPPSN
jgi:hypothetical protein